MIGDGGTDHQKGLTRNCVEIRSSHLDGNVDAEEILGRDAICQSLQNRHKMHNFASGILYSVIPHDFVQLVDREIKAFHK